MKVGPVADSPLRAGFIQLDDVVKKGLTWKAVRLRYTGQSNRKMTEYVFCKFGQTSPIWNDCRVSEH